MIEFALAFKIDRVLLQVSPRGVLGIGLGDTEAGVLTAIQVFNPNSPYHDPYPVFNASSVATHFVDACLNAGISPGLIAYARPKDTGHITSFNMVNRWLRPAARVE